ncbi:MAG: hypothetical protein PHY47_27475 [Lachnospiraceae bacterium]|nr:hypothetical protein [Lachnospiraceae bacterium]
MSIDEFRKKALMQDKRNVFECCSGDISFVPIELQEFFKDCNPMDVEITMDGNAVRFYPLSDLIQLQEDYDLTDGRFVFATCNSDPIYIFKNEIYTRCHGNSKSRDEKMANSFVEFLELID